jgi:hypothetical protein
MSDFASTGNFREVLNLARRATNALERIADALSMGEDSSETFPLERIADAVETHVSTDNLARLAEGIIERTKATRAREVRTEDPDA